MEKFVFAPRLRASAANVLFGRPRSAIRSPPQMRTRDEIPTPALLLDLDAFESNITIMVSHVREHGRAFRPHAKTHKCPEIARRLIDAGAIGVCAARLSEAEVFADHGISGLLVTTAVIGQEKIARAAELARRAQIGR